MHLTDQNQGFFSILEAMYLELNNISILLKYPLKNNKLYLFQSSQCLVELKMQRNVNKWLYEIFTALKQHFLFYGRQF